MLNLGRQMKIPGYKVWKNLCTSGSSQSENKAVDEINQTLYRYIKLNLALHHKSLRINNYTVSYFNCRNYNDMDLLSGGLLETPSRGAVFGPTFSCLLANQFSLVKNSDRFWYENDFPPSTFGKNQLQEIRQSTLARILCANFEDVTTIQPKAFIDRDDYL